MATLQQLHTIEIDVQGETIRIKQGKASEASSTPYELTVTGRSHKVIADLATASADTLWDGSTDALSSFDIGVFWADQDCHLQLIDVNATGTNVILEIDKYILYVFSGTLLAAADETKITNGGTTLRAVDQIVIGNSSGETINYKLVLID